MPSEISGTKMAIEIRNISSNRAEPQEQRKVGRAVETADQAAAQSDAANQANSTDTVFLSDKAQEVQNLISSISQPPASNQERLEAIRTAIDSGTFSVSAETVASKILAIDFGNGNQTE